ncbi:OmpA family protein [Immundisolibacter sp.]|uniref:OmpA family protein n=1 Tax=Immundisolibacter sp. TaxID=1934948 RepID=UPI002613DB00|nr:OmpA family protein [Immundisolibacter sp.]MDD3651425.1 OmpA family protein [Immundisolibacter sp.]
MNTNKHLLIATGLAALVGTAAADELDRRWYLSAGIGYAFADDDRELPGTGWDIDGGPAAFAGIGKAINDWLNLELNLKGNRYDLGGGNDDWKQYGATFDGLFFFNRNPKWAPYAVLGAGEMHSTKPGKNWNTPIVEAGLGVMHVVNDSGDTLRAEVRHRWDFTDLDRLPGNDDKTFDDWTLMVGVTIPLGKRAAPAAPVAVAAAEPAPTPAPPPPPPVTTTQVLDGVKFCFDCDWLSNEAKAILDGDAMAIVKAHPNASFEIAGHTDAIGSEQYNLRLSQRRAEAVRDYLVQKGADPSRMTAVGYGESQPVADNATAAGRAQNRRVELRVTEKP